MGGNGHELELKPICQLYKNANNQLILETKIKNMITLAKWLANALHTIVRQIPEGEEKKIITPRIQVDINRKS